MERPDFQYGYSRKFARYMYDEPSRRDKALRAIVMVRDFIEDDLRRRNCLVMGSSTGIMAYYLANYFGEVVGIDIDTEALAYARHHYAKDNVTYNEVDAQHTLFPDDSFDVIVCHHTYEHVYSSHALVDEIYRLMKVGGVCYFGAPNRLMIMESHHGIPFLSWLPRMLANTVVRIFRNEPYYYERMLTYWGLKKLLRHFVIHDYTLALLKEPTKYHSLDVSREYSIIRWLPTWLIGLGRFFYPDYVWILTKKP